MLHYITVYTIKFIYLNWGQWMLESQVDPFSCLFFFSVVGGRWNGWKIWDSQWRRDLTTLALWLRVLHNAQTISTHCKNLVYQWIVSPLQCIHISIHLMMVFSSMQRMMDNISAVMLNVAGSSALEKALWQNHSLFFYQLKPYWLIYTLQMAFYHRLIAHLRGQ